MAKLKGNVQFEGRLGDLVAYTRKDIEGTIIQSKGGASSERVKKGSEFAGTRKQNKEFSGLSKGFSLLNHLLMHLKPCMDYNISFEVNRQLSAIQQLDTESELGKRSGRIHSGPQYLEGFQFNKSYPLESICMSPLPVSVDRSNLSATVQVPVLRPGKNFLPPEGFSFYKWVFVLGVVPDLLFNEAIEDYKPVCDLVYPCVIHGDWLAANAIGEQMEYKLVMNAAPIIDQYSIVVAGGIMFGAGRGGLLLPVKRKGGGKILRVM
jgi:hypothetical protein